MLIIGQNIKKGPAWPPAGHGSSYVHALVGLPINAYIIHHILYGTLNIVIRRQDVEKACTAPLGEVEVGKSGRRPVLTCAPRSACHRRSSSSAASLDPFLLSRERNFLRAWEPRAPDARQPELDLHKAFSERRAGTSPDFFFCKTVSQWTFQRWSANSLCFVMLAKLNQHLVISNWMHTMAELGRALHHLWFDIKFQYLILSNGHCRCQK